MDARFEVLQRTPRTFGLDGQNGQGIRLESSAGPGQDGSVRGYVEILNPGNDWPGREFGIRKPYPTETPLSWAEVKVALNGVRDAMKAAA